MRRGGTGDPQETLSAGYIALMSLHLLMMFYFFEFFSGFYRPTHVGAASLRAVVKVFRAAAGPQKFIDCLIDDLTFKWRRKCRGIKNRIVTQQTRP